MEVIKSKDSGIAWIGHIPEHWRIAKLKRLLEQPLMYGTNEAAELDDTEFPRYIRITDFDDNGSLRDDTFKSLPPDKAEGYYLEEGDILFARSGATVGKSFLFQNYDGQACFAGYLIKAQTNRHRLLPDYLYYFTKSPSYESWKNIIFTQATIQNISATKYAYLSISVPPLLEQRRVVAYLDKTCAAIDTAIEKKQKQIETLNTLRKAIIHKAVTSGLDDTVELKDSGVEWSQLKPVHWKTCRVKDILDFFNTVRVPLSADIRGAMTDKTYDYYGASGVIDKVEGYLFDGTYILIAEDGANLLMRNSPLAFLANGKFWVNNHAHILKPRYGNIRYFVHLLESLDYSLYVTGAAQPKLTKENLGRYKIIVPPEEERNVIAEYLDVKVQEFKKLEENIKNQIATLQQYRKSLIHECVTGKRRVAEAAVARAGMTKNNE